MDKEKRKRNQEYDGPTDLNIGVKLALHKDREIEDCLNCLKTKCNACPITEVEYLPKYMNRVKAAV